MKRYLAGSLIAICMACSPQSEGLKESHFNGYAQGTTFHISFLYDGEEPKNLEATLDSLFQAVDLSMSTYRKNSLISKLNRGDSVMADIHLKRVHQKSIEVHSLSEGFFDPTVGKLVNYFGFGPKAKRNSNLKAIDSLMNYVGLEKLNFNGNYWQLKAGFILDYNAIAQGYTVDLISDYLETLGIRNYMVEVGGEVRCLGQNIENQAWRIGVDKPVEEIDAQDRFQFILGMDSLALATSGNYRKFWVDSLSGERYAHTINPNTGVPARNRLLSASVLASTAMEADAFATAFMSMGLKKSIYFVEQNKAALEVYFIYGAEEGQWQIYQSPGFQSRILN